jgi:cytochrome oxidase Cu insertion factor (SCO1/SenC/PrrC family)
VGGMGQAANLPAQYLDARLTQVGEVALLAALAVVWVARWLVRRQAGAGDAPDGASGAPAGGVTGQGGSRRRWWAWFEAGPPSRTLLQAGFGALWLLDGLLQAQPAMPRQFVAMVLEPAMTGQPRVIGELGRVAVNLWSLHTVTTDALTVFLQVAIGWGILVGGDRLLGRCSLAASVVWGTVVWLLGEGAGDLFGKGGTFLSGTPGAVLVYVGVALLLLWVPASRWDDQRAARVLLWAVGGLLLLAALLQGLPAEGFWHGQALARVFQAAAQNPQPSVLAAPITAMADLARSDPVVVNALWTAVPAVAGVWLLIRRAPRGAVGLAALYLAAAWWLGMDFGVLGGTGTDPNIALPVGLLLAAAWMGGLGSTLPATARVRQARPAVHRLLGRRSAPVLSMGAPSPVLGGALAMAGAEGMGPHRPVMGASGGRGSGPGPRGEPPEPGAATGSWWQRHPLRVWLALALWGSALWCLPPVLTSLPRAVREPAGVTLADVASGGLATIPGHPPVPRFRLENQDGQMVTPASFRGKVVFLSFLDPVCYATCPVVAEELAEVAHLLRSHERQVAFVAIDANPDFTSLGSIRAFDAEHGLTGVPNWQFLTGSPATLEAVWAKFGAVTQVAQVGMVAHSLLVYVIGPGGREQAVTEATGVPGPRIEVGYAEMFADEAASLLPHA